MNEIMIKIKGSQNFNGNEENDVELTTKGVIEKVENGVAIIYEESELTGMQGTTTKIVVDKKGVITLYRSGTVNSCLVFEEGKKNISYYDTEAGAFSIAVFANYLEADINENGGIIEIDYVLEADGSIIGQNEISVSFSYISE